MGLERSSAFSPSNLRRNFLLAECQVLIAEYGFTSLPPAPTSPACLRTHSPALVARLHLSTPL